VQSFYGRKDNGLCILWVVGLPPNSKPLLRGHIRLPPTPRLECVPLKEKLTKAMVILEINLGRLRDTPSICEAIIPR